MITSIFKVEWSVEDPVYPYQSIYEFTLDELKLLSEADLLARQQAEYDVWLANLKAIEQGA